MSFPLTGWWAQWPEDGETLLHALAVASAFRERFAGCLRIAVVGDIVSAGASVEAGLTEAGISHSDLPDVVLEPGPGPTPGGQRIDGFAELFAVADERFLRMTPQTFSFGLPDDCAIAAAASAALHAAPAAARVVMLGDGIDGIAAVAGQAPVTVVALSPLTRCVAAALALGHPVDAVSRPPSPVRMPAGDIIAIDGRRGADLRLAPGVPGALVAIAHAERLSPLCLAAYGLDWIDRHDEVVLAAVPGRRDRVPRQRSLTGTLAPQRVTTRLGLPASYAGSATSSRH